MPYAFNRCSKKGSTLSQHRKIVFEQTSIHLGGELYYRVVETTNMVRPRIHDKCLENEVTLFIASGIEVIIVAENRSVTQSTGC